MPKASAFIRALIDKGIDAVFDSLATKQEEKKIELPPALNKYWIEADKLLHGAESVLGRHGPSISVPKAETQTPQSLVYCLECCDKHFSGGSKLLEEAIIFYDRAGRMSGDVTGKVRTVVNELAGVHDDIKPKSPAEVMNLLHEADRIRKSVWVKGLELGLGTREDLVRLKDEVDNLKTMTYEVASKVLAGPMKWCRGWGAKDMSGCIELVESAMQGKAKPGDFNEKFEELTGKKPEAEWDDKGRVTKIKLVGGAEE